MCNLRVTTNYLLHDHQVDTKEQTHSYRQHQRILGCREGDTEDKIPGLNDLILGLDVRMRITGGGLRLRVRDLEVVYRFWIEGWSVRMRLWSRGGKTPE